MSKYGVRMRYAGAILVNVDAENETEAQKKGQRTVEDMNTDTFLSALELQHLDTEVTRLCPECDCELHLSKQALCNKCKAK